MNPVYLRLVIYALSSLFSMLPAAWAGWVSYDAAAQMVQVSVPGLAAAAMTGLAVSGGIFARWGVK